MRAAAREGAVEPDAGPAHAFVLPGQVRVAAAPATFTTILGSCVTVCLFDRGAGVGGLNHFLLPGAPTRSADDPLRWAEPSCEALLAAVILAGARRKALEAKLFGGAHIAASEAPAHFRVGDRNVASALAWLARLQVPVVARAVGGAVGRKLVFEGHTGGAWVRELARVAD